MTGRSTPGPAPVPVHRSLQRLRWLLTVWFTLVLAAGVVVLLSLANVVADSAYASAQQAGGPHLTWPLAVLGAVEVAVFGPLTWTLLGYLLGPVTRSLGAQESFLNTAAHDLRTPLATLVTLIETARHDPGQREETLDRAARLLARNGDIVENLLLRARLSTGILPVHTRPARLDQVVEGVIADLTGAELDAVAGPDGRTAITIDLDGHRITMEAAPTVALIDTGLAERAIANLIHNALRHGHEPGQTARIAVTVWPQDGRALVAVADTGPGLRPPVTRPGLGLSVVRWVARVHGGALLLGTGAEPGTRIRLAFAASRVQPADIARGDL
jgi:two-component system, OmpR family, sensor kinase